MRSFINLSFFSFCFILLLISFLTSSLAFVCRESSEDAIQRMQGKIIGQQVIQISWASTLTARQVILHLEIIHIFYVMTVRYVMVTLACVAHLSYIMHFSFNLKNYCNIYNLLSLLKFLCW